MLRAWVNAVPAIERNCGRRITAKLMVGDIMGYRE